MDVILVDVLFKILYNIKSKILEGKMEVFDGFISAVAAEFQIKFHKDSPNSYTTKIEFENDRSQEVLVTLTEDESGDKIINYYSVIGTLKRDLCELYKYALQINSTLQYGGIGLLNDNLILRNSILLQDCDPRRFMKSLTYIAAKADEFEELLLKE